MSADPAAAGWTIFEDSGLPEVVEPLWVRQHEGARVFGFQTRQAYANGRGVIHGGILATFIDHALGLTVREAAGGPVATIQLDLHYLAAGRVGQFIEGHGEVTRLTRSVVFVRGSLVAEGATILTATGLWKRLAPG